MLFLYLAGLITALYCVSRILAPEMSKSSKNPIPKSSSGRSPAEFEQATGSDNRVEKLSILLAEKNKNIQLLQTELKIFHVQVRDFEKVKTIMEEEIRHLREQNRMFRSELGLPQGSVV